MNGSDDKTLLIAAGAILLGIVLLGGGGRGSPLVPLLLAGAFLVVGSRRGWFDGGRRGRPSGASPSPPRGFEEWHRRAQMAEREVAPAAIAPAVDHPRRPDARIAGRG